MDPRGACRIVSRERRAGPLLPVNGQKLCQYAEIPFGWCKMGHNGCVILAIYNALLLSGYRADVMEIRKQLHRFWKPRFFGVRVWEISRYLKKRKIPFRALSSPREFVSAVKPGAVAILMSWNRTVPFCHFTMGKAPLSVVRFPDVFGGAHGVCVEHNRRGSWVVYNRYSNRRTPYDYPDFESFRPFGALFMKGFLIEPFPEDRKKIKDRD